MKILKMRKTYKKIDSEKYITFYLEKDNLGQGDEIKSIKLHKKICLEFKAISMLVSKKKS